MILHRTIAIVFLCAAAALAQRARVDPATLPARDAHQNLLVAADPYLTPERYEGLFGKKSPYDSGIVALDVYFRNDNDSPIRVDLESIRLIVAPARQRLSPLSPEEVADRVLLKGDANPKVPRRPLPFPTSRSSSGKGKAWDQMAVSLRAAALSTDVVPPHATVNGFLFFDLDHQFGAVARSRLYVPELSFMTDSRALLFFELELGANPAK